MGRIKEYSPQTQVRNAPEGVRARGQDLGVGGGLEQLGQQISGVETGIQRTIDRVNAQQEQKEKSAASVAISQNQAEFTNAWQEKLKQPNPYSNPDETDPTKKFDEFYVADFLAEYDEKAEKQLSAFKSEGAKQYFQENSAQLRAQLGERAIQSQSVLAGEKAKLDFTTSLSNSSSALVSDPKGFEFAQKQTQALVNSYVESGRLDAAKAQELLQQANKTLAVSALKGLARINPEQAQKELESTSWDAYIDGPTKDSLYGEVRTESRAKAAEEQRTKSLQKEAVREHQNQVQNEFLERLDKNELSHREVLDSPLEPAQKRVFLSALNRKVEAPNSLKTNPAKFTQVFEAINAPEGSPDRITTDEQLNDAFQRGGMSVENLTFLRKELHKGKTDEGKREQTIKSSATNMIKETIMRSAGPKDPQAPEMNYRAQQEYLKQYEAGIKAGKTPAELADPEFVKSVMKPFIRTPVQKLESKVKAHQKFKQKAGGDTKAKKMSKIDEILKKKGLQ